MTENSHSGIESVGSKKDSRSEFDYPIWVVVKIRVPFCVPIIIRHLLFGVPKKGP